MADDHSAHEYSTQPWAGDGPCDVSSAMCPVSNCHIRTRSRKPYEYEYSLVATTVGGTTVRVGWPWLAACSAPPPG
eukprot:scaffold302005_cov14-Prasinocladus_malaysianus.AAC.1